MHISDCCQFSDIHISQGSVATYLRCGGIFKYYFVANLLVSLPVKELWKSVNIWGSYGQVFSVLFFSETQCTFHSILLFQFTCLTVLFHNLSLGPLWSSSWAGTVYFILHTFLHPHNTCTYYRSLFCCSTEVMSSIPNLCLSSLLGNLTFTLTSHIHLTILISLE